MVGLPKRIIDKYGISKKAWSVFRSEKKQPRHEVRTMARRLTRRRTISYARRARHRSHGSSSGKPMDAVIGGGIYGLVRAPLAGIINPLASKLPLGAYSQSVGLGIAGWLACKYGGHGIVKKAGLAALTVESATVASGITSGMTSGGSSGGGAAF